MLGIAKVSNKNRNKFEIVAEILRKLRLPTGRTNIMSHCNMNTLQSGEYLNLMKSNDLIRVDAIAGKVTYQRTEVGRVPRTLWQDGSATRSVHFCSSRNVGFE